MGPGRIPRRPVFSQQGSINLSMLWQIFLNQHHTFFAFYCKLEMYCAVRKPAFCMRNKQRCKSAPLFLLHRTLRYTKSLFDRYPSCLTPVEFVCLVIRWLLPRPVFHGPICGNVSVLLTHLYVTCHLFEVQRHTVDTLWGLRHFCGSKNHNTNHWVYIFASQGY